MSPDLAKGYNARHRFPRVSGDEPFLITADVIWPEFSPRERG